MRTMTPEEIGQVAGGILTGKLMDTFGRTVQHEVSGRDVATETRAAEGDGMLPWTPPTPGPCGAHRICQPTI